MWMGYELNERVVAQNLEKTWKSIQETKKQHEMKAEMSDTAGEEERGMYGDTERERDLGRRRECVRVGRWWQRD